MTTSMTPESARDFLFTAQSILFDLDGVLTPTAKIHQQAWNDMLTAYFAEKGVSAYTESDYFTYLDGRRRDEGIAAILASRNIELDHGSDDDTADDETVIGLGVRKNEDFLSRVEAGVDAYPGSVKLLDALAEAGVTLAVVSSSKNAIPVLRAAGILDRFALVVDGIVAHDEGLVGKPAPDTFVYAAEKLGADIAKSVVVEDAISGVQSGAAGNFGLVLGVNRGAGEQELLDAGANIVVADLAELVNANTSPRS